MDNNAIKIVADTTNNKEESYIIQLEHLQNALPTILQFATQLLKLRGGSKEQEVIAHEVKEFQVGTDSQGKGVTVGLQLQSGVSLHLHFTHPMPQGLFETLGATLGKIDVKKDSTIN